MRSFICLLMLLLLIFSVTSAYRISYQAQAAAARIAELESSIEEEQQTITILNVEWNYLNRSDRLMSLVERFNDRLLLQPLKANQIAPISDSASGLWYRSPDRLELKPAPSGEQP